MLQCYAKYVSFDWSCAWMIVKQRAKYAIKLVALTLTCVMRIFLLRHGDISKHIQTVKCSLLDQKKCLSKFLWYTCQHFFNKMREIVRLQRTWISKDLPTASGYCRRFRKNAKITEDHFRRLPKDFQRLPKLTEDVERFSKRGHRFPKDSHPIDFSNVKKKKIFI